MKLVTLTLIFFLLTIGCYSQLTSRLSLIEKITSFIIGLHRWSDGKPHVLLEHNCSFSFKGRIHKLKLVWDGKFTCPGWTYLVGESRGFASRNGALEHSIKDFVNKALQINLITSEQAFDIGK
jgi:hypothetical protein